MNYNLITILGPTAVGKTRLGALLANRFDGEIISADSRQVYKRMNLGTGKDLNDYVIGRKIIPYHLIDVIEPEKEFDLFNFNKLFYQEYQNIVAKKRIPFLVGGTGMYLNSILSGYDLNKVEFDKARYEDLKKYSIEKLQKKLKQLNPLLHNTTDLLIKDRIIKAIIIAEKTEHDTIEEKIKINSLVIGIYLQRCKVKDRITVRLKNRIEKGMIEEVKNLLDSGISYEKLEFFGLEYKYIAKYLKREISYYELFEKLNIAIHQFSKRQMTWYRKMERNGIKINWIKGADFNLAEQIIIRNYF